MKCGEGPFWGDSHFVINPPISISLASDGAVHTCLWLCICQIGLGQLFVGVLIVSNHREMNCSEKSNEEWSTLAASQGLHTVSCKAQESAIKVGHWRLAGAREARI